MVGRSARLDAQVVPTTKGLTKTQAIQNLTSPRTLAGFPRATLSGPSRAPPRNQPDLASGHRLLDIVAPQDQQKCTAKRPVHSKNQYTRSKRD